MTYQGISRLVDDRELAHMLSMSASWVRKQRFLRRHGKPHALTIDPVMIGAAPRYSIDDVRAWLSTLKPANHGDRATSEPKEGIKATSAHGKLDANP